MATNAPGTGTPAPANATLAGLFGAGLVNPATMGAGLIAPMPLAGMPPPITSAFNYQGGGALPANQGFPFANLFPRAPTAMANPFGAASPPPMGITDVAGGGRETPAGRDFGTSGTPSLNPAETTFGSVSQIPGIGTRLSQAFDWLGQAIGNAFGVGQVAGVDVVNAAGAFGGGAPGTADVSGATGPAAGASGQVDFTGGLEPVGGTDAGAPDQSGGVEGP